MNLETLVARGEQLHEELGREWYLTGAGLKPEADFQAIYDRHAILQQPEAFEVVSDVGVAALVEWIVDLRAGRATAPFEERQLAWEQTAVLTVGTATIPYLRAGIDLKNSADRSFRIALDRERSAVSAAGLNGLRRDRFTTERDIVCRLVGSSDYIDAISRLSGIDLTALAVQAERLLADTDDLYRDALARLVQRRVGVPVADLLRADAAWAFRADGYDAGFPPDRMVETAIEQMRDMGLDATEDGRVRLDTDERPGKQPRAFCVPVRVPGEVYVVLRPSGGHGDYRTFWHELGHAMHFAAVDPGRPFHERRLGDNSVTECFAMLWDHLTVNAGWLAHYTELGQTRQRDSRAGGAVADLVFELAVAELYMLRRYAAKLGYEIALHRSEYTETMAEEYAERLTDATGFRYPADDYLHDVDPGFYAARYLRAWQLEATVARVLVDCCDEDWYRHPRAGGVVRALMQRGQADPADVLAADVGYTALTFEPALERLATVLT